MSIPRWLGFARLLRRLRLYRVNRVQRHRGVYQKTRISWPRGTMRRKERSALETANGRETGGGGGGEGK